MKYIVTTTEEGEKEMFIFPDSVNHKIMAESICAMRDQTHGNWKRIRREPVSAGFVEAGFCCGKSESLGLYPCEGDSDLLNQMLK